MTWVNSVRAASSRKSGKWDEVDSHGWFMSTVSTHTCVGFYFCFVESAIFPFSHSILLLAGFLLLIPFHRCIKAGAFGWRWLFSASASS